MKVGNNLHQLIVAQDVVDALQGVVGGVPPGYNRDLQPCANNLLDFCLEGIRTGMELPNPHSLDSRSGELFGEGIDPGLVHSGLLDVHGCNQVQRVGSTPGMRW